MRFSKLGLVAVSAGVAWVGASADAAVLVTTEDGNGADTHISNDSHQAQTTNHGAAPSNSIRVIQNARAKLGVLRFDLSGVSGPVSDVQLQLELTFSTRTRTWNLYGLNDDGLDAASTSDNWDEGAITFSSTPGIDQAASGVNTSNYAFDASLVTPLATMQVGGTGLFTSDVNTAFDDFINAAINSGNNNFVTIFVSYDAGQTSTDTNPDWAFAAKEHATAAAPTLLAVPEPASLALASLGGLALLGRRRA